MMAQKGVTGIDRAFEGEHGFMNTYFGGRFDRDAILRDLGREYLGSGTLYKRWPCVGTAHSHMKAAIDIITRNGLDLTILRKFACMWETITTSCVNRWKNAALRRHWRMPSSASRSSCRSP